MRVRGTWRRRLRRRGRSVLLLFLLPFAACGGDAGGDAGAPASAVLVEGDGQEGRPGAELSGPLVARVVDADGRPVPGAYVWWEGDGEPYVHLTDTTEEGITRNYWTLGPDGGPQRLELRAFDPDAGERGVVLATFTATARP